MSTRRKGKLFFGKPDGRLIGYVNWFEGNEYSKRATFSLSRWHSQVMQEKTINLVMSFDEAEFIVHVNGTAFTITGRVTDVRTGKEPSVTIVPTKPIKVEKFQ